MLVGAYGMFWDRSLIDWNAHGWRMLGRQGMNAGTIKIADFRKARGVYCLVLGHGYLLHRTRFWRQRHRRPS